MNATELRIGNSTEYFIKDELDERKEWWEVNALDIDDIADINFLGSKLAGYRPIPLTEEWLLKFGFEHREFSFDKGSFFLSKRTGKNEYLYQAHTNRFQVKYVHQLQNLYFSLTAIELTVA